MIRIITFLDSRTTNEATSFKDIKEVIDWCKLPYNDYQCWSLEKDRILYVENVADDKTEDIVNNCIYYKEEE